MQLFKNLFHFSVAFTCRNYGTIGAQGIFDMDLLYIIHRPKRMGVSSCFCIGDRIRS